MFDRFATAIQAKRENGEQAVLRRFKRAVAAYIKWVTDNGHDPADLEILRRTATFDEAKQMLTKYEDPEVSFMSMVNQGYFI